MAYSRSLSAVRESLPEAGTARRPSAWNPVSIPHFLPFCSDLQLAITSEMRRSFILFLFFHFFMLSLVYQQPAAVRGRKQIVFWEIGFYTQLLGFAGFSNTRAGDIPVVGGINKECKYFYLFLFILIYPLPRADHLTLSRSDEDRGSSSFRSSSMTYVQHTFKINFISNRNK